MASGRSSNRSDPGDAIRELVTQQVAEKVAEKLTEHARKYERISAKAARRAEAIDLASSHLGALDVWMRNVPGARRARFTREDITAAAIRIADREGIDAVSMRRIATDLDAGTMTLYHYVRTKDELFALVTDAVMGEVLVPRRTPIPEDWRAAITLVARRTRDSLRKHSWILDVVDDPPISPNTVMHFDQSLQAVASFPGDLEAKLDVITSGDEYVFGYCLHERQHAHDAGDDPYDDSMIDYVMQLIETGAYPALAALVDEYGAETVWNRMRIHAPGTDRFERTLARLLNGLALHATE